MEESTHTCAQSFLLGLKHFFGSDVLSLILSTGKMCAAGGGRRKGERERDDTEASFILLTAQL